MDWWEERTDGQEGYDFGIEMEVVANDQQVEIAQRRITDGLVFVIIIPSPSKYGCWDRLRLSLFSCLPLT